MKTLNDPVVRWITLKKFCECTGVNVNTARYYIRTGKLKTQKNRERNQRILIDLRAWNEA